MEHLSIALTMSVFPFAIIIHHHYCSFSRTLEELDLGNGLFDHCATAVQVEWTHMTQVLQHRQVSLKVQRNAISREAAQPWLQDFVVPEWKQDIQTHVSTHNAHILASQVFIEHARSSLRNLKRASSQKRFGSLDRINCRVEKHEARRVR